MDFYVEQFRKIRKQERWTLSQLAQQCGVDSSTLSRWESGKNLPSESHIRTLANILDVSVSTISDLPDNKQNAFIDGIKNLKILAKCDERKFEEEEEDFITRIKQQREHIKKAKLVINCLLDTIPSAFYIKDNANKYLLANNEFLKIVEMAEFSDIGEKGDKYLFPQNEAEQNAKMDKNVLALTEKYINKQGFIPGTRKKKWGMITKLPIRNQCGKVEGMVCTIKDITEEKKANELNLELTSAISNIQDVIWTGIMVDYRLKFTSVNGAAKELLGIAKKDFFKGEKKWKEHVHPDFLEDVDKFIKATKNGAKQVEYKYIHPISGETRWLQNRTNVDGQHHFGIIRDITNRKNEEYQRQLLEAAINSLPYMVFVGNFEEEKFNYSFLSKGIENITNTPRTAFTQYTKVLSDFVHKDDLKRFSKWRIDPTFPEKIEVKINTKEGIKWIANEREKKEILGKEYVFGTVKDVSELKRNTLELKKLLYVINNLDSIVWIGKNSGTKNFEMNFVNKTVKKFTNIPGENFCLDGKAWEKILHPDDKKKVLKWFKKPHPKSMEYRIVTKKGIIWIEDTEFENSFLGEKIQFGIARDISKRKEREQQLNELMHVVNQLEPEQAIIWIVEERGTNDFNSHFISNAAEKFTGIPLEQFYKDGLTWNKIIHPDDIDRWHEYFRNTTKSKTIEYRLNTKHGIKWVKTHHEETFFSEKKIHFGITRDITVQKNQEKGLQCPTQISKQKEETCNKEIEANGKLINLKNKIMNIKTNSYEEFKERALDLLR